MLNKLVCKEKLILFIFAVVYIVTLALTLIFGRGEDKVRMLILSPVLPIVIYLFFRIVYKLVFANATYEMTRFFICFFIIGGMLGVVTDTVVYITAFPNGLSPALGACMVTVIANIEQARQICDQKKD